MKRVHKLWPLAIWHGLILWWYRTLEGRVLELDPAGRDLLEIIERRRYHEDRFGELLAVDPQDLFF